MDEMNYKPNSRKFKEEQTESVENRKKLEKVVQGTVKTKKKNEMSKLSNVLISEDAKNVKSYIVMDVMIPAFKKLVSDVITNGIDMLLYGGSGRKEKRGASSKVSYRSYYDRRDDDRSYARENRTRDGYSYDDIILDSRGEAEDVIDRLCEMIDTYGIATVGDLYDLVGVTGNYTDNKYGWTNLRNAKPVRTRDGYLLDLPRALPIN